MRMGEEDGVHSPYLVLQRLISKVGAGINKDHPTIIKGNARGRSIAMVFRMTRCAHLAGAPGKGNAR